MTGPGTDRPPLVLLGGMNCSADLWTDLDLGEALSVELDQPTLEDQVRTLLDRLPRRCALVGLSLGGIVALATTRFAPERVAGLCLLSTNPRPPTPEQQLNWRSARTRLAAGASARELQHDLLPLLHSAAALRRHPDLERRTLAMAEETGSERLDLQLRLQASRIDERPALTRVVVPTRVIAAADDALCSVAMHEEIADRIDGAELHLVPGCGHLSPLERPVEIGSQIRSWHASLP